MATPITIEVEGKKWQAELNDNTNVETLLSGFPMTLRLSRWGDEYYGDCGITVREDSTAREIMEVGEIALWPPGNALCLFFGPTPASTDDRPRAASPVVPIGKIKGDATQFGAFGSSIQISFEKSG